MTRVIRTQVVLEPRPGFGFPKFTLGDYQRFVAEAEAAGMPPETRIVPAPDPDGHYQGKLLRPVMAEVVSKPEAECPSNG